MPETVAKINPAQAPRRTRSLRRLLSLVLLAGACTGFFLTLVFNSRASALPAEASTQLVRAEFESTEPQSSSGDFSVFSHQNEMHARLPCLLCHRREDNKPQVRLPGHMPCSGCHVQQFADSNSRICMICHTDAQSGAVKPFPRLKSFNVKFDHALHTMGAGRSRASCAACHRAEKRGVALSIPSRLSAHSTCFQCHTPGSRGVDGRDISSCNTCHNFRSLTRTPQWAAAYRVNFSHTDHGARRRLTCTACHNIRAGASQGRQVTAPVAQMHRVSTRAQSCASCHNDKRAFGINDFANCKRCHEGPSFRFSFLGPSLKENAD
jgi:c(7)-type cytochrome triheme protein